MLIYKKIKGGNMITLITIFDSIFKFLIFTGIVILLMAAFQIIKAKLEERKENLNPKKIS